MKIFIIVFVIFSLSFTTASASTAFGLFAGLSSPNDDIYTLNGKIDKQSIEDHISKSAANGYHIGAKIRFSMSDDFEFIGSAAFHKFPENDMIFSSPNSQDTIKGLHASQNIIPIAVGINYFVFKSFVAVYASGELTYNYLYGSVDYDYSNIPIEIDKSPVENRVGFGIGAGVDFDAKILLMNIEAKYNIANLIGSESGEEQKNYFTLSLGVFF